MEIKEIDGMEVMYLSPEDIQEDIKTGKYTKIMEKEIVQCAMGREVSDSEFNKIFEEWVKFNGDNKPRMKGFETFKDFVNKREVRNDH